MLSRLLVALCLFSCEIVDDKNPNQTKYTETALGNLDVNGFRDFREISQSGVLRVVIKNSPTSYFIHRGQPMGYEYELCTFIANKFDLELKIIQANSISHAFELIQNGSADIMAYNLTITKSRKEIINFSTPLYQTQQVLIQKKPDNWREVPIHVSEKKLIRNPLELANKTIVIEANTSYKERLQNLSQEIGEDIFIIEAKDSLLTDDLINLVSKGDIMYTVADSDVASMHHNFDNNIDVKTSISLTQNIAWGLNKKALKWLDTLNSTIKKLKKTPDLVTIHNRYFGHTKYVKKQLKEYQNPHSTKFISRYDAILKAHAKKLNWDWRLLAAITYTESNFDRYKVSWVGAKGLMQLMPVTIKQHHVKDAFDPDQNITGGVDHLSWIDDIWKNKLPDSVDRIPYVLTSYNAGPGHVTDAFNLALAYNENPYDWAVVSKYLLLKSKPKYYQHKIVKHGYLRGSEPVNYLVKINSVYKNYQDLIPK